MVGTAGGGIPPGACATREAAGAAGGLMLTLGRRLTRPAVGAAPLLHGLPRLPWLWAVVGVVALLAAATLGVLVGPVHIGIGVVIQTLLAPLPFAGGVTSADPSQASSLWSLRITRVVLGAIVRGMLGLAGSAYQGVLR